MEIIGDLLRSVVQRRVVSPAESQTLWPFAVYCLVMGVVCLIYFAVIVPMRRRPTRRVGPRRIARRPAGGLAARW